MLREHATKDDFEKALRANKEAKDEVKSDQRDAAVAVGYIYPLPLLSAQGYARLQKI